MFQIFNIKIFYQNSTHKTKTHNTHSFFAHLFSKVAKPLHFITKTHHFNFFKKYQVLNMCTCVCVHM